MAHNITMNVGWFHIGVSIFDCWWIICAQMKSQVPLFKLFETIILVNIMNYASLTMFNGALKTQFKLKMENK